MLQIQRIAQHSDRRRKRRRASMIRRPVRICALVVIVYVLLSIGDVAVASSLKSSRSTTHNDGDENENENGNFVRKEHTNLGSVELEDGEMNCREQAIVSDDSKTINSVVCSFRVDLEEDSEAERPLWKKKQKVYRDCTDTETCIQAMVSREFIERQSAETLATESSSSETVPRTTREGNLAEAWSADETPRKPKVHGFTVHASTKSKEEHSSTPPSPIRVGAATYNPPFESQHGINVGNVLKNFHSIATDDFFALVDWYVELGHAHMDDADYGIVFAQERHYDSEHPKAYYIQLAIHAYTEALKSLKANDDGGNSEENIEFLQYHAIVEFALGEAYSAMAESGAMGEDNYFPGGEQESEENKAYGESSLLHFQQAQKVYETLRYTYARAHKQKNDPFFTDERYYSIEKGYAYSCTQYGMALYRKLIQSINEQTSIMNEKAMESVKAQMGLQADASDDEIVQALMNEMGGGNGAGGGPSTFTMNVDLDAEDIQGGILDGMMDTGISSKKEAALVEIATYLDTAVLTYQQHAEYPSKDDGNRDGMAVIVNGVPRKSKRQLREEDRLFDWRASLAMGYQNAAQIASARQQYIRARELMNLALQIYTDVIFPYYEERGENNKSESTAQKTRAKGETTMLSSMTHDYAKAAVGELYQTLTETALSLGMYADSKEFYAKAMDWHMSHYLAPSPDGEFNALAGDDVARRQYQDFLASYRSELEVSASGFYRDDQYEAEIHVTMAAMYMSLGDARAATRSYIEAIQAYRRILGKKKDDDTVLSNVAEAQAGLARALYQSRKYSESSTEYQKSADAYLSIYGEGTPPKPQYETALEDMKDEIIKNYGEEYYELLRAHYGLESSESNNNNGAETNGNSKSAGGASNGEFHRYNGPKITNYDVFGYANETEHVDDDEDDDLPDEEYDDGDRDEDDEVKDEDEDEDEDVEDREDEDEDLEDREDEDEDVEDREDEDEDLEDREEDDHIDDNDDDGKFDEDGSIMYNNDEL